MSFLAHVEEISILVLPDPFLMIAYRRDFTGGGGVVVVMGGGGRLRPSKNLAITCVHARLGVFCCVVPLSGTYTNVFFFQLRKCDSTGVARSVAVPLVNWTTSNVPATFHRAA